MKRNDVYSKDSLYNSMFVNYKSMARTFKIDLKQLYIMYINAKPTYVRTCDFHPTISFHQFHMNTKTGKEQV